MSGFGQPSGIFGTGGTTSTGLSGNPFGRASNTSGLFGSSQPRTQSATGGLFSNVNPSANTNSGGLFGGPAAQQTAGGCLVGSSNTDTAVSSGGLFGRLSAQQHTGHGLFGRPNPNATGTSLFGNNTNDVNNTNFYGQTCTLFGNPRPNPPSTNLFGNTNVDTRTSLFGNCDRGLFGHSLSSHSSSHAGNSTGTFGSSSATGNNNVQPRDVFGHTRTSNNTAQTPGLNESLFGARTNTGPSVFTQQPCVYTSAFDGSAARDAFGIFGNGNRCPPSIGTHHTEFQPTLEKETYGSESAYYTITFMQPYKPYSFEELRLADYNQGQAFGSSVSIKVNPYGPTAFPAPNLQPRRQPNGHSNDNRTNEELARANIRVKELEAENLRHKLRISILEDEARVRDQQIKDITAIKPFACTCKTTKPPFGLSTSSTSTTPEVAAQGTVTNHLRAHDNRMQNIEAQLAQLAEALQQSGLGTKDKSQEKSKEKCTVNVVNQAERRDEQEVEHASGLSTPAELIYTPGSIKDGFVEVDPETGKEEACVEKSKIAKELEKQDKIAKAYAERMLPAGDRFSDKASRVWNHLRNHIEKAASPEGYIASRVSIQDLAAALDMDLIDALGALIELDKFVDGEKNHYKAAGGPKSPF